MGSLQPESYMGPSLPVFYNCRNCPSYCCSYPQIPVTRRDLKRLAKHLNLDVEVARRRYTKKGEDGDMVLRHQRDEHYGMVCRFLDTDTRLCTIHPVRPVICSDHPGTPRCGYYGFLMAERRLQEDDEFVARAYNP